MFFQSFSFSAIAVCLFVLLRASNAFKYVDCGSAVGTFTNVSMSLCEDAANLPYCPMKRGTSGTLEIDFESAQYTHTLAAVVHGVIGGIKFPVHLPNKNACNDLDTACPVEMYKPYTYRTTLPILQSYIKVGLEIQWELQDDTSANVVCITFPARIVD
ncbi:unnamed protein product [Bemisia tabaci]|uniref:MD-2-related lipid-recognition domain-containing protein n=1 Tax=Bemisia tabaci TaxID=7038 RepID=A0A9P0F8Y3_BEMTA|nr:PREDICTED: protein NPC2 homolog [Bemisia tabaci]CAH0392960.1 unnamed protein product [Bemisia tabaci]